MATCNGCTSTWTGLRPCHCSGCHRTFGGIASFDHHRIDFTCREPSTLGMVNRSGIWGRVAPSIASEARGDTENAA